MTILVIGGTGQIGSLVVGELAERGATVSALGQKSSYGQLPKGVEQIDGDVLDVDFMRELLPKFSTLFILNPVVADELTRGLLTVDLADEAVIRRIVYFSMINADTFADVPHASAKFATEQAIAHLGLTATILRASYFFQNDVMQKVPLTTMDTYAMPLGGIGVASVDARDIAEVAALELIRREQAPEPLPTEIIEIVGPESFTGASIAALWSEVLGRPITYAGDDLAPFEKVTRSQMPPAMAYDTALMFRGFQRDGMLGKPGAADRLAERLGRPLRTYRAFAEETAATWNTSVLGRIADAVLPGR